MEKTENYFIQLSKVECLIEKKNWLNYVSWSDAWSEVKKLYPEATYKKIRNEQNNSYLFPSGIGGMVECEVTINGITHSADLAVTDFKNQCIKYEDIKSTDIQNTLQRAFTKAIAMHGLWFYVYRGEDLPEDQETPKKKYDKPLIGTKNINALINMFKTGEMSGTVEDALREAREHYNILPDQEKQIRTLFSKEII